MKKFVTAVAALALGGPAFCAISPQQYIRDVKVLASEEMKGRGTGSPQLEKAGRFIANEFKKAGLKPVPGNGFEQAFTVSVNSHLGPQNKLEISNNGQKEKLKIEDQFLPFNFSGAGVAEGRIVFAGYGITAPEYNYDDYAGLDVKDKIVVVLRHEPQEYDSKSIFNGRVYTEHAQLLSKATNAKMHGAKAILMVADTSAHQSGEDALDKFSKEVSPASPGIPFVQIRAAIVEKWFEAAGKSFKQVQDDIDKDLKPRSFAFPAGLQVTIQTDVRKDVKTVHNVAGYVPGLTDEYVIVGAHYDHLGLGEQFSLAPSMAGSVHPGADDNASGTAGVLSLARYFAHQPRQKRGILFLAFAGEELGLLGSSYYANHPELPLGKAVAMINMDMIGRIRDKKIFIGGVRTGSNFKPLMEAIEKKYPFQVDASEQGGYGSSDHTSFTTKQLPVLFFFSGLHGDYHKPSDTWDKIDASDAAQLLDMIAEITTALAAEEERPQYVRVQPPAGHTAMASGSGLGGASGYGPYFGSIPDFSEPPTGVRFADVRDGSPAAKAGLKAGDIMVGFDGKKIGNLYDFTYALRSKRPGDEVEVEVLRDSKPMTVRVLLAERK